MQRRTPFWKNWRGFSQQMKGRKLFLVLLIAGTVFMFQSQMRQQVDRLNYPQRYVSEVSLASELYEVDRELIFSIIKAESRFFPYAKSWKNARGLMQLSENTWKYASQNLQLDIDKIYERESNIRAGTWYFSELLKEFQDEHLAIIAYNAGPSKVREWISSGLVGGKDVSEWEIPYRETKLYLYKVIEYKKKYLQIYGLDGREK